MYLLDKYEDTFQLTGEENINYDKEKRRRSCNVIVTREEKIKEFKSEKSPGKGFCMFV